MSEPSVPSGTPSVLPGTPPSAEAHDPGRWLGSTSLLDLEDPKLRLRARALTQLCKNNREKALAVYGFVKRVPFAKPFKLRMHTPREVLDAGRGDAPDKAVLLVGLLRLVDLPARLRYVELRGDILRGLTSGVASAARPVAEVWLNGRWVRTDTYIFDAVYMAAARQRLKDNDWEWGYGIHRNGHGIWNGVDDAFLGGMPTEEDPMALADLGVFHDPLQFISSDVYKANHPRVARAVHWNMLAPLMDRVVRDLREDIEGAQGSSVKKTS